MRGRSDTTRLKLGLLAPQFPPGVGGMQELAFGMACGLTRHADVTVYTLPQDLVPNAPFAQKAVLAKRNLESNLRAIRDERIDVWCAMDAGLTPMARALAQPCFAYFHGNDFLTPGYGFAGEWSQMLGGRPLVWRFAKPLRRVERHRVMRRSLGTLREIFTNSTSTASLIDARFPGHGRTVTVVPPGVADVFFQTPEAGRDDTLRLLTVSRLTRQAKRKNVDGILHALGALAREAPTLRFHYTIVGDGNDRARLEALAASVGLTHQVTFAGFVTREELLAAFRRADLFVLAPKASAHDVEGFGMVYIEASASGLPVLGSTEGGAIDAIADGVNGLLINSSEPAAIAAGIRRFVENRAQFSAAQVTAFAEGFRWPSVTDRLWQRVTARLASPST